MRRETIDIELADVETPRQLHEKLATALSFPEYYGHNWDAFDEVVRFAEGGELPRRLVLTNWALFLARLPREARLLETCVDAFNRENPERACRLELL